MMAGWRFGEARNGDRLPGTLRFITRAEHSIEAASRSLMLSTAMEALMARTSGRSAITFVSYCVLSHAIAMTTGILHAQESARLHSGDRVRVTVPRALPTTRVASLLAVRGYSLLFQTGQPLTQFAVVDASPALLEVSLNPSAPRSGGLAGGFAGFVVGGLIAKVIMNRAHSAGKCSDGFCGGGSARERWDAVVLLVTVVDEPSVVGCTTSWRERRRPTDARANGGADGAA